MRAKIESTGGGLVINDGANGVPFGQYTIHTTKDSTILRAFGGGIVWTLTPSKTTVDGEVFGDAKSLAKKLNSFNDGGGAPGEGVQSVTGDLVDSTDPNNPKVNMPVLQSGQFLVGGASGNENRKITPSDVGNLSGTGLRLVSVLNGEFTNSSEATSEPLNGTVLVRTPTGQGKFSPGTANEDAVVVSQLNESLQDVVKSVDGTIPESLLPSYVDNVQEGTLATFPNPGMANIVYLDTETNKAYRWGGSSYVEINSGGVAIGETSATAYRGDRGKEAYEHISDLENPHAVTASQVGLGNVDNTKDADKPISAATQSALNNKMNKPSTPETVPVVTVAGVMGHFPFAIPATPSTFPFRDNAGRVWTETPTSAKHAANKEYADRVWTPDYSNMETTNRITTHGGTWTVPSGRRGWVKLYTRTYTGGVLDAEVFLINGKVMENIWQ